MICIGSRVSQKSPFFFSFQSESWNPLNIQLFVLCRLNDFVKKIFIFLFFFVTFYVYIVNGFLGSAVAFFGNLFPQKFLMLDVFIFFCIYFIFYYFIILVF